MAKNGKQILFNAVGALIHGLATYSGQSAHNESISRVYKSWRFLLSGYEQKPEEIIKTTPNKDKLDGIALLKNIEVYSLCEHHFLPFFGKAHVAYIPVNKVVGISKLARVVDMYARRFQTQEKLCEQVANCLVEYLEPKGAACVIEADHLCMRMRGVEKQNSTFIYSSLKGAFLEKLDARNELMALIK